MTESARETFPAKPTLKMARSTTFWVISAAKVISPKDKFTLLRIDGGISDNFT